MTVTAALTETVYALTGSSLGPFSTVWPYNAPSDVTVQLDVGDGNGPRLLAQGADYTLNASSPTLTNGGSVTLASHVLVEPTWNLGALVAIVRSTPRSQPSSFGEAVGFSPKASEQALDNVERQVQEMSATLRRAVLYDYGEGGVVAPTDPLALWTNDANGKLTDFGYGASNVLIGTDNNGNLKLWTPPNFPPAVHIDGGGVTVASYAELRASAFVPAPGADSIAVVLADPWKGGIFVPANGGMLTDDGGMRIVDANGTCWRRVFSGPVNAAWYYDNPAPASRMGDGKGTLITAADQAANPQWIGLPAALGGGPYPVGTTWESVAILQAIYACFARGSTPGAIVWNSNASQSNLPLWLPPGYMPINQPFYLSARGVDITFAEKAGSALQWKGAKNVSPVMFDAISYGEVHNLTVLDQVGVSGVPLVDVNWTGANPGLKTQQLTFYDMLITGPSQADSVGFYVSRSGGASQGDTIALITPSIFGCYTGIVAGGTNALNITILGGNIQSNFKNGCVAYGGSFMVYSMSMEAAAVDFHLYPQAGAIALDGADAYIYGGGGQTARCVLRDYRSENIVLCYDRNHAARLDNVGTAQAYNLYGWGAGAHSHLGMLIATTGAINKVCMCVDDSGPAWIVADAASTNTKIVQQGPSPGWAANRWVGFTRWFRYGNSYSFAAGPITASDANSVTDPNGFYSPEPFPGFVPGQLANYLVKVCGVAGSTAPAWDTFPPGLTIATPGTPQFGLTTGAGSNVVSSVQTGIANGQYMVVCDAIRVQAPPAGALCSGALIGKVQNYTAGASFNASLTGGVMTVNSMTTGAIKIGAATFTLNPTWPGTTITGQLTGTPGGVGTYSISNPQQPDVAAKAVTTSPAWELVNSIGDPQLATRALVDANGYWGTGIPDGQLTWLPIDFDVMAGVASGDGIDPGAYGKFRDCGYVNFAWAMDTSPMTRFRAPVNAGVLPNFSYRNGGPLTQSLVGTVITVAATTLTPAQIARGSHLSLGNALAAFTLSMPIYFDGLTQDFRLYITNNNAAGVLTWGANVKAANPTVALGAVGKMTVVTLAWIGAPAGAGVWLVTNVQGPM